MRLPVKRSRGARVGLDMNKDLTVGGVGISRGLVAPARQQREPCKSFNLLPRSDGQSRHHGPAPGATTRRRFVGS
jgi:hypothetical protein